MKPNFCIFKGGENQEPINLKGNGRGELSHSRARISLLTPSKREIKRRY
jgi:hypothetical protein